VTSEGVAGARAASVAWLEEQLARLREQQEALTRELAGVRLALVEQGHSASDLEATLTAVDGRTRRHEAAHDAVQAVQRQVAQLAERLDEESVLRHDQHGAAEREHGRERDLSEGVTRALGEVRQRLQVLEQRIAGEQQRGLHHGDALADADRERERLTEQLHGAEGRMAALAESWAKDRDERARFAAAIPELTTTLAELGTRTVSLRAELRRSEDELAQLRGRRDREDELVELVEAQRATRARLEERITAIEERVEEMSRSVLAATEERQALYRQVAGADERIRGAGEALEGQRWATIEHFRRLVEAEEEQARLEIESVERRIRRGRMLLVRLTEGNLDAGGEKPL